MEEALSSGLHTLKEEGTKVLSEMIQFLPDTNFLLSMKFQLETLHLAFDAFCVNSSLQLQNGAEFCNVCWDGFLLFLLLKANNLFQGIDFRV